MSAQKIIPICFSPTKTTKTVLNAIAEGFELPITPIDMTLPAARDKTYTFAEKDILLIGFPVYGGRIPLLHEGIFSQIPNSNNPVIVVVVYGNRAYDDALLELATLCESKGYTVIGAAAFIGEHSYAKELATQRPDKDDLEKAKSFGKQVYTAYKQGAVFNSKTLPGTIPFKERPPAGAKPVPKTNDTCINCQLCIKHCPTGAFPQNNPLEPNPKKCILCAACIKICPMKAKEITFTPLLERMKEIVANNKEPKQPEIFLPS